MEIDYPDHINMDKALMVMVPTGKKTIGVPKESLEVVKAMLSNMGKKLVTHYTHVSDRTQNGWWVTVHGTIVAVEVDDLEYKQAMLMDLGFMVVNRNRKVLDKEGGV